MIIRRKKVYLNIVSALVLIVTIFSPFNFTAHAATLLTDDFTGTTIDTDKWSEIDTAGTGGTTGNITQSGTLSTANGYVATTWGTNALTSVDTFDSTGLEVSAVMTNNSDQLLGYGDHNFQSAGTKAFIIDALASNSVLALTWDNGSLTGNASCGTFTDGATYRMKLIASGASGFEVYKDDVLQCTLSTALTIDNKKVFLQSSTTASIFDDVLVTGNAAGPTAPDAPTGLTATPASTQMGLSWTAPASNGGSALTDYLVEYKLASEPTTWTTFSDGTSTSTSTTVTGLTNALSYNFRVSAINAVGTSTPSSTATATPTAPTAPGAPTSLGGVSGNNLVSLSWTAPVSNGGSAITDYLVEYKLNSEPTTWSTFTDGTSTSTSATVTGLTNDVAYNFRVSAINAIGTSTASDTANATPGQAVPLTIDGLVLWLDGSDADTITESSGLISEVTDKSANDKNGTASADVRPTLVSSVQNGRSVMRFDGADDYLNINSSVVYRTIFVVAKSDDASFSNYPGIVGDYTGTSPSNGHIVNGVDGTTKIASATSNYTSAYRNGTSIAGSSGHDFSPLNEFWIGSFELSSSITNTTSAIGMINGGGRYWDGDIAEIIAYNVALDNTDRALVEAYLSTKWGIEVAGPTAPDAPTGLGASKGDTQISLSWTAPVDDGSSAITDYLVEYKLNSEPTTWSTFADGTSTGTTATVTGLTNDLSYDFRVSAINAFGTSTASATATKTPGAPTAPDAPTIGTATAGNTEAYVAFSAPADNGGSAITSYTATSSPGNFTASGASSPLTVTGLTNGVEYTFTVTATNAIGTSSSSSASNAITPSLLGNQLTDSFTGTTINTTKWFEFDPYGKGGTAGKITQSGTLSVADSFANSLWGANALISQDGFSATGLEISAVINTVSNPLIGYGDYNFGISDTKAYLLYAQHGSTVLALSWEGASSTSTSCGTATSGATFKMKIISGGFEVYKNGSLQCTHTNSVVIDNKPVFLEVSTTASTFDDVVVYGTKSTAVAPGQVTGLSVTGMNKQALLNWDAPTSNGYAVISDYTIQYKLSSADSWSTFSDGTSQNTKAVVTGLVNGSAYDFRVSAVNSYGAGTVSATVSATPDEISNMAFVITGESNSGGIGLNSAATAGEVASRSSVQILELTSGNFLFENLDIGTNNLRDHTGLGGYYDTSHGLELGLANNTEAHYFPDNEQVYLIKTGHGGSQVSEWNYAGTYFTKFLQRTAAAKTQLDADRKWVVWMSIGINDGISGTNINTFKTNLTTYIDNIKADLPGAIIIMTQFQSMPASSGYPTINTALADVAALEPNVYVVDTTTATGTDGANHWTYAGLKTVASLMATTTKNVLGLNYPGLPTSLGATPSGTSVALSWTAPVSNGGSAITDYVIEYKTNAASTWTTFSDGTSTSTSATVTGLTGSTAYNFRISTVNANGTGNATSVNSTTTDGSAPTISAVASTPSSTSVAITWTTDEDSSSIVDYGLTNAYGTSTAEEDTSPRVSSHSVTINSLIACTTYSYRVKSNDSSSNLSTGSNNTFTTSGCTGNAEVVDENQDTIETATGGTVDLLSGSYGLSLNIPSGATDTDAIFQIKQLDSNDVISTTSTPASKSLISDYTYELKSLSDVDEANTSFNEPITITLTYEDSDVSGVNESTLQIYRWNGTAWSALSDCVVDANANTVTCTTSNFSLFGLFGGASSSGSRSGSVATTSLRLNTNTCLPGQLFNTSTGLPCTANTTTALSVRDLKLNMSGEDAKQLQKLLNANGYTISSTGPGSIGNETNKFGPLTQKALIRFQKANNIVPSAGYFGPKTRAVMKELKLSLMWW